LQLGLNATLASVNLQPNFERQFISLLLIPNERPRCSAIQQIGMNPSNKLIGFVSYKSSVSKSLKTQYNLKKTQARLLSLVLHAFGMLINTDIAVFNE
jgi:hypothetical protein